MDRLVLPDQMTAAQLAQLKDAVEKEEARRHLLPFIMRLKADYVPSEHHWLLCEIMELVEAGVISRLITEMPPRHGKSQIVSVMYPAWYLGKHPGNQVISLSYSSDLANDFSRAARDLFKGDRWPFPGVRLSDSAYKVERWYTNQGGVFTAGGRSSSITGRGAHHLGIDDPYANREEATSPAISEEIWSKFTSAARTRLMPGATVSVTQTRWTDDDLAGRLQKPTQEGAGQWFVLKLPALSDGPEVTASVTIPDDLARHASIPDGTALDMHELVGRLRAAGGVDAR